MDRFILVIGCVIGACAPGALSAATIQSTFDANDEGWVTGDFLTATGSSQPAFIVTGGNPGGFIRSFDIYAYNAYHAPAAFLGNQSDKYGSNIHIDLQATLNDGVPLALVIISDGILSLQYRAAPPGTTWTSYNIPLLASAGWEHTVDGIVAGTAATEGDLQQVLASLAFFHINADWHTGVDTVDLDNVQLGPLVPEPSSMFLLASGSLGLGLFAQRRRKSLRRAS